MRARRALAVLAVATTALGFAPATLARPAALGGRPNIVLVLTDDQTVESMRVLPTVQRELVDRGTVFDNNFVNLSMCCPSRSTLFTGQYAHNHHVVGNTPPAGGYTKLDKLNYLPLWLRAAGYRTQHVGKFLNGYGEFNHNPHEVPPGWDDWYGSVDPSTYSYYGYALNENGHIHVYGRHGEARDYQVDVESRIARRLIARDAGRRRPFFLSLAVLAPHAGRPVTPHDLPLLNTPDPPPRYRGRFAHARLPYDPSFDETDVSDKPLDIARRSLFRPEMLKAIEQNYRQRLETLLSVDDTVRGIMRTLRRTRQLRNTLIVFTSDNGYMTGEHRVASGKVLPYEPSIRVPLVLRGPGVPRGAHRRALAINADLAPTFLDAANARAGLAQDGRHCCRWRAILAVTTAATC